MKKNFTLSLDSLAHQIGKESTAIRKLPARIKKLTGDAAPRFYYTSRGELRAIIESHTFTWTRGANWIKVK